MTGLYNRNQKHWLLWYHYNIRGRLGLAMVLCSLQYLHILLRWMSERNESAILAAAAGRWDPGWGWFYLFIHFFFISRVFPFLFSNVILSLGSRIYVSTIIL